MFTVPGGRGTMASFSEPGEASGFPPAGAQVLLSGKSLYETGSGRPAGGHEPTGIRDTCVPEEEAGSLLHGSP